MGQGDKHGPRGESVEADIRKNVLNAKIEASNNKHITQLESLDGNRKMAPDQGKYFSAKDVDSMPREYTYITKEQPLNGKARYFRTIIMMEQRVSSKLGEGYRRPDFIQVKYELSADELKLVNEGKSFSQIKGSLSAIKTKYMEIRSIDFNTPLHVNGAVRHFKKHVDTAYSSIRELTEKHNIFATQKGAVVNVVVKEWYHKSTSWWDKHIKAKLRHVKGPGLAFFESHTAVFSLKSNGRTFDATSPKVESVFRDKTRDPANPRRLKHLTSRAVAKLTGKQLADDPAGKVPEKLKHFGKEIRTLKQLLPRLVRLK